MLPPRRRPDDPGVVHDRVDAIGFQRGEFVGSGTDRVEVGEVEVDVGERGPVDVPTDAALGGVRPAAVARRQHHTVPRRGELLGGVVPEPGARTGDDDRAGAVS
ncbi:hypothetical protein WDV91_10435 [Curtobacterium flaccumfaciens pv. flaccumfaciens]